MKKFYWLYMEPYVHISVKGGNALVYNALNGKLMEYDNPIILHLVKKLKSKKNLLVVRLSGKELADPDISGFVKEVRENYSGDLIDTSYSKGKPILMMPQVKIQKDVEEPKAVGESAVGEGIMDYLAEITLYINNRCRQNCSFCKHGYKQFLVCTKGSSSHLQELEIEKVEQFIKEAEGSAIFRFNISGGNIFTYPKFSELVQILNRLPKVKTYQVHYLNLIDRENELKALKNDLAYVNIFVDFPVSEQDLEKVVGMCAEPGLNCEFNFVIQKEAEVDSAQEISSRLKITNVAFKPFYNHENFDFFKTHVFINREELLQAKPTLKDIFSRTRVNPLQFGKITVLSNKDVHANVNAKKIGVLGRDSLYDVVFNEMFDGKTWIKPRPKVSPCRSCNYSLLCPPLTNYEYVLKRNNLCNILY